jgi:hypothetical protein
MGHAEVAPDVLLGLGALLVADEDDRAGRRAGQKPPTIAGSSRNSRSPCSSMTSVPIADQLEGVRPAHVARQLDARPDLPRAAPRVGRRRPVLAAIPRRSLSHGRLAPVSDSR